MLSSDREDFDAQIRLLCAGYNVPATPERLEAYWTGLQRMTLPVLVRIVEAALGPDGPEKLPTVAGLWGLYREFRQRSRAPESATRMPDAAAFDSFHAFGQRCLLRFLMDRRGVSSDDLPGLIAEKNRLAVDFRSISSEEEVTAEEVREAMFSAFRKVTDARRAA